MNDTEALRVAITDQLRARDRGFAVMMSGVKPGDEFAGQVGQLLAADWPARVESLRYSIEVGALQPDVALQLVAALAAADDAAADRAALAAAPPWVRRLLEQGAQLGSHQRVLADAVVAIGQREPRDLQVERDAAGNAVAYRQVPAGHVDYDEQLRRLHDRARNGPKP